MLLPAETSAARLELLFVPPDDGGPRYQFRLINESRQILAGFRLSFCGPGRIDPLSAIEGGRLIKRFSNHTEVAPPDGRQLAPGEAWQFAVLSTSFPLRHFSDAALAAYLTLADGAILPVMVEPCRNSRIVGGAPRLDRLVLDGTAPADGLGVVPRPRHVDVTGARAADAALRIETTIPAAAKAAEGFAATMRALSMADDFGAGEIIVRLGPGDDPAEGYTIRFGEVVAVTASDAAGFYYALVTLGQIRLAARREPALYRFPAGGEIRDRPEHGWRGAHLDVARQFYTLEELRRLIAVLGWSKLNRFHLHLSDDEAWRFEVKAFAHLTAKAAFRGAGLALPPLLGSGPAPYGGFYRQDELAELVRLADQSGITIVPEIDMPGHCYAAITALPELRDPDEVLDYTSGQGFAGNSLNSAVPGTLEFAKAVFDELAAVFPGRWLHLGGDEVPPDAWATSPLARRRLAEIGATEPHDLQADFISRLYNHISGLGRITVAWEEAAGDGGLPVSGTVMMAWFSAGKGAELAAQGYDVVMAPGEAYYLDMALGADWWEPGASWGGTPSPADTYRFDPLAGFADADKARMIGVEACIWSEQMGDRRIFDRLVFPRLYAVAETGWTRPDAKDYARFAAISRLLPGSLEPG